MPIKRPKREYYALFSCDQWKSRSSMVFNGVFTLKKLKSVVKKGIKKGDFGYMGYREKIDDLEARQISDRVDYLYIEPLKINEEV